ncbi:hypothetical protein [Legionella micdadei]|uniref:T2SS substrate NttA domain-containing protein n=1 Tax=Legionella micdadei TaxID=451 RepID=A0A098GKS3_LEGMI|nr:hypothetical protein [Legionella micdadei]ARG98563.1 hypothetical protein B6N58_13355 [Legionella micdadei]ARH01307.1 hypothetical protein B6V88_13365 [Legionella micdadei]KTD27423.1 hypothetical protein Lmic_2358 [Legionella micdadei]NSL19367.1 hypothetical protein [Legionella micdadei]CEG62131.1 exported protein of unknown function [Legionella micdadei]
MRNNLFFRIIISIGFAFLSTLVFADETPKDAWIRDLKELAPEIICKSFIQDSDLNKKMKAAKIDYEKCLTLIPASFDKCQAKYYSQIPDTITKKDAEKWGNNLGMCIGGEFTVNYLLIPQ